MRCTKEHLIKVLGKLRQTICAYGGGNFCDCKYVKDDYENLGQHHEAGNSCPELLDIVTLLSALTQVEFEKLDKRLKSGKVDLSLAKEFAFKPKKIKKYDHT